MSGVSAIKVHYIALFMGVFFSVCVLWSEGSAGNDAFMDAWNCIAASQNQAQCDQFNDCVSLIPVEYMTHHDQCVEKLLPDGIGNCNETHQFYGSEDIRKEFNVCYGDLFNQAYGTDWTTVDNYQDFLSCIKDVADCSSEDSSSR
ncbi:hypothetical protein AVEN_53960-1 [Araneus ventricosus]|uniref:Uncharacterized protein n=1 Tax=Araneus ventricosus TaxID=182803 RepID=A0A4Y2NYT6_ARAVE|nr:hypothetical protein AVEN_53960-1 [Araneus ventricosus]